LVGQRALLRAEEEAADEDDRRGQQRDDQDAELQPERQPHRAPPDDCTPRRSCHDARGPVPRVARPPGCNPGTSPPALAKTGSYRAEEASNEAAWMRIDQAKLARMAEECPAFRTRFSGRPEVEAGRPRQVGTLLEESSPRGARDALGLGHERALVEREHAAVAHDEAAVDHH